MPQAVLFDLDGVLVDTYTVWEHLLNDLARRLGYPAIDPDKYRSAWGQGIEADVEAFYPRHTIEEMRQLYAVHYEDHLGHLRVMDGAREMLDSLAIPKAVVTNSPIALARRALRITRLEPYFGAVVGCDEVPRSKPAPDMLFEACRRLGVDPTETLMVGDSDFDEEAACAARIAFVRFRSFADLHLEKK